MTIHRKLRFWFEWAGPCLWGEDGPVDLESLSLSNETKMKIEEMSAWHDKALNWDYPPDPGPWRQEECDRFNKAATELYHRIQSELAPEYEVLNCQESLTEDPDLDEYLKDPINFRRDD